MLPDFCAIRTIADRQVLITKDERDDDEDAPYGVGLRYELPNGVGVTTGMGFELEPERDAAFAKLCAGEHDEALARQIAKQDEDFGKPEHVIPA